MHPSLIGICDVNGEQRLVLKLARRKNQRYGSSITRPCFCNGSILVPSGFCPIHNIWPIIRERTELHGLLFPSLQRANINRILKASLRNAGFPDYHRYSMYCFRRGCLMEMKNSNSAVSGNHVQQAGKQRNSRFTLICTRTRKTLSFPLCGILIRVKVLKGNL